MATTLNPDRVSKSIVLEEKLLFSVDPAHFMSASAWLFHNRWSGDVDVSTWLRVNAPIGARLYLFVVYHDQQTRRVVTVDRCMVNSSDSNLLNGRITLAGKGALKSIQIKLKFTGCNASSIFIEECAFKPRTVIARPDTSRRRVPQPA